MGQRVMRVAALYDIHGNLPALEAVLGRVRQSGVDRIVVGGDVVPGPMLGEALACLLDLDVPVDFIQGNCEVAVLAEMAGLAPAPMPEQARAIVRWTAQQLSPAQGRLLASWPKTLCLDIEGLGSVMFCHATPRHDNEIFTRLTPEERLRPLFEGLAVSAVICGHTHMQFDRIVGTTRVVNAGSVGMPFGAPGAYWLLLGPDVRLQHTPYDLAAAADRILATQYPQAQDFVTNNVLKPPSEESMLEELARAEVRFQ
jgi:predicted phosphodiesterase